MSLSILTNVASLTAQNNLNKSSSQLDQAIAQLSSGLRINSPADNPAGYAISQQMQTQINGFNQAIRNTNDGISFTQVANGAMNTITQSIQSIRTLAVQASNASNSAQDRQALNRQVQQDIAQVNTTAQVTQFNGQNILNGSLGSLVFQTGADVSQNITVKGVDVRGQSLGASYVTGSGITTGSLSGTNATGTFTINGAAVTLATAPTSVNAVVAAINQVSNASQVYAQRDSITKGTIGVAAFSGASGSITLDSIKITIASGATPANVATAINAYSTQTGVTATATATNGITLTDSAGANITAVSGSTGAAITSGGTISAGIELYTTVNGSITIAPGASSTQLGAIGLASGSSTTTTTLNEANVLTYKGAQTAIKIADFALTQMTQVGGLLGALQNRFQQTISNLQSASTNTQAARGRIVDANFAQVTAQLSRAQVLQQAGVAMVAQANAAPQVALTLLK